MLAEQRRILREAVAAHAGARSTRRATRSSSRSPRAERGVGAAVAAQRALAAHEWPDGGEVRVRMGLHTGEPRRRRASGYVGIGVHRAARIGAVAHGGQVLLSNATRELVEDEVAGRRRSASSARTD